MNQKAVYNLIESLDLKPAIGSKLAIFCNSLEKQTTKSNDTSTTSDRSNTKLMNDTDQGILDCLKRLQVIKLTRPILNLCIQSQTRSELNQAKNAGIETVIDIPDPVFKKLNSLDATYEEYLREFTDIKEADAEELNKKFNLVTPPHGPELSLVLTLVVAAFTILAFIMVKAEGMMDSAEAYWGFFIAGILILFGINAVAINLIKLLKFKKNRASIIADAKRKYLETAESKYLKLKQKIEEEGFQIQNIEYSKAAVLKLEEIDQEEREILKRLNS